MEAAALDVALGLGFVFLLFSLVCSAINEAVATALGWRAKTLQEGLANLVEDPDELRRVFQDPLVRGLVRRRPPRPWQRGILRPQAVWERGEDAETPDLEHYPSYIPSRTFVSALLGSSPPARGRAHSHADRTAHQIAQIESPAVREAFTTLWRQAGGDVQAFRLSAERWYDDAMERVSGWYRRKVQIWLVAYAVAIAFFLNVDTIQLARTLWSDDALRQAVATQAQQARPAPGDDRFQDVADQVAGVEQLGLPLWWTTTDGSPREFPDTFSEFLEKLAGLLVTAVALSMGAPFWFDALSKIARLRGTGAPPPATDAVRRGEGEERRAGPGEDPGSSGSMLD